ncbi:hypothetical protein KDA14_03545, partial [Candidatus Saccharibacteria bacterium]|nr:hypothetical protein [Candidatus Saccharibacteria bacterium]
MPNSQAVQYSQEWEDIQKERFDGALNRDVSALLRESSPEFNFLEIKTKVENVLSYVAIIAQTYDFWSELSEINRSNINSSIDDMIRQFNEMEKFDPKQNSAWELRNNLIQEFNNRYNNFYQHVVETLNGYLGRKAYTQELAGKFGQEAKRELTEIKRVRAEIEKVQTKVNDAAAVAGDTASTAHSISFGNQAKEHKDNAHNWLLTVIFTMAASLAIVLLTVYETVKSLSSDSSIT